MAKTFYFYDLETSGLYPREARIMQFAGQRTDMDLKPIGRPDNVLIKMTDDIVPDPFAVLVTGITPQQTIAEGITEAEFLKLFYKKIALSETIFTGYNSVRFDDEFMRYLNYRNFYDPYEWQYQDGRSRWDLLDVVRMTRALRPEGITWPNDENGKATNRLELLAVANNLEHDNAHDALSDVKAVIALAGKVKSVQPKLFDFLLGMRKKEKVSELVSSGEPFVYTSGKYQTNYQKTTIAVLLANHPKRQGALVYDLRYDPTPFTQLSSEQLADLWRWKPKDSPTGVVSEIDSLPIKTLQYNRCPAIAPLNVLEKASQKRLHISVAQAEENYKKLKEQKEFINRVLKALGLLDEQQELKFQQQERPIDARLYEGFFSAADKRSMRIVQKSSPESLAAIKSTIFSDSRLQALLPLYRARNFPGILAAQQHEEWEKYRTVYLLGGEDSRMTRYFNKITELRHSSTVNKVHQYILEELQLYGESIMPES